MTRRAALIAAVLSITACGISGMPRPPPSDTGMPRPPNSLPTTRPVAGDPNMVPSLPPGNVPATGQQLTGNPSQPSDAGFPIPLAPPQVDAGPESP